MNYRQRHRARISLPVRLRWNTPFGQKIEFGESIDATRNGLLVACNEQHALGMTLWVTFPYDTSLPEGQPEMPARVVRSTSAPEKMLSVGRQKGLRLTNAPGKTSCGNTQEKLGDENGNSHTPTTIAAKYFRWVLGLNQPLPRNHTGPDAGKSSEGFATPVALALHLETPLSPSSARSRPEENERRASARSGLALPIYVRPEHVPWFEEAMTVDVSAQSLRFLSNRDYEPGTYLVVSFESSSSTPWPAGKEFRSRVLRVEPVPNSPSLAVTVCRV